MVRITFLSVLLFVVACDPGTQVDVAACTQNIELSDLDFLQADYDRFSDSTTVSAAFQGKLIADLLRFDLTARHRELLDPPKDHEVGDPTLSIEFACSGDGICRPAEVLVQLIRVAHRPIWSGTGEVIFLMGDGERLRAPVLRHGTDRGNPGDLHVTETASSRMAWNDFLRLACAQDAAFSYEGLEGKVHAAPLRGMVRAVETGMIEGV